MMWKRGFNKGQYYCWIGWVNKYEAILSSSLHHIRIIILKERKGDDFVISCEGIHDTMICIIDMMIGYVRTGNINHSAHCLRAPYIISDPLLGKQEMYINLVAHLKYSYLLRICPTATYRGYSCHRQTAKNCLQTTTALDLVSSIIFLNLVKPMCLFGRYFSSLFFQQWQNQEYASFSYSQIGSTQSLKAWLNIFLKQCLMMQSVVLKEIFIFPSSFCFIQAWFPPFEASSKGLHSESKFSLLFVADKGYVCSMSNDNIGAVV